MSKRVLFIVVAYAAALAWFNMPPRPIESLSEGLERHSPAYAQYKEQYEKCLREQLTLCDQAWHKQHLLQAIPSAWRNTLPYLNTEPWGTGEQAQAELDAMIGAFATYGDDVGSCAPRFLFGIKPGGLINPHLEGFDCPPQAVAEYRYR